MSSVPAGSAFGVTASPLGVDSGIAVCCCFGFGVNCCGSIVDQFIGALHLGGGGLGGLGGGGVLGLGGFVPLGGCAAGGALGGVLSYVLGANRIFPLRVGDLLGPLGSGEPAVQEEPFLHVGAGVVVGELLAAGPQ